MRCLLFMVLLVHICTAESYFESIYSSMMQVQRTIQEAAVTVNKGLKTLAQTIRQVEKFIDSTVDEDCNFECPKGSELNPKPNHTPKSNGCGSLGVFFNKEDLPRPEMVDCCNEHDNCYDTCGSDKDECDFLFKRCLYDICATNKKELNELTMKTCKGGAKILYTATIALGCSSFRDAQEDACICTPVINSSKYSTSSKDKTEL
ncbi:phospholipase A2 group XII [Oratosquilla oratoria]|uniref:phospholipase A2 group XII n=1 Tax=Oratosquilla oratoria TaxID=337810 RepID=UPI003F76C5DF